MYFTLKVTDLNNYAISTEGLSTALRDSASSLLTAGNDINEAMALITAGNAVAQDPSSVGAGMRTISLRLAGTKAAAAELEEMGEDTEDMIRTTAKLRDVIMGATKVASNGFRGFDILNDNGNYKSTYEIMQGIADIYDEIIENDKKTGNNNLNLLLETMAGKNRSNIAASILQSGEILRSAYQEVQFADGSAEKELQKKLESIEGRLQKLYNAAQKLATDFINSDILKYVIDFATDFVNMVDSVVEKIGAGFTTIGIAITGFSSIRLLRKFGVLEQKETALDRLLDKIKEINNESNKSPDTTNDDSTSIVDKVSEVNEKINELKEFDFPEKLRKVKNATSSFGEEIKKILPMLGGLSSTAVGAITAIGGLSATALIGYGVWKSYNQTSKKVDERVNETIDNFKNLKNNAETNNHTVQQLSSRLEELSVGVDKFGNNIGLSNEEFEEYHDICNQIIDVYPQLLSGYDSQGNAILSVKGNVDALTQAYKENEKAAYNSLLYGKNGNENKAEDIINQWNKLSETDWQDKIFDLGKANIGGDISVNDAISSYEYALSLSSEEYKDLYKKIHKYDSFNKAQKKEGISRKEWDFFSYDSIFKDLFANLNLNSDTFEKDFANVLKQANAEVKQYKAEVKAKSENIKTVVEALVKTSDEYESLSTDQSLNDSLNMLMNNLDVETVFEKYGANLTYTDVNDYVDSLLSTFTSSTSSVAKDALIEATTLTPEDFDGNVKSYIEYMESLNERFSENGEFGIEIPLDFTYKDEKAALDKLENNISNIVSKDKKVREKISSSKISSGNSNKNPLEFGTSQMDDLDEIINEFDLLSEASDELNEFLKQNNITTTEAIEEFNKLTAGAKSVDGAIAMYIKGIATSTEDTEGARIATENYYNALEKIEEKQKYLSKSSIFSGNVNDYERPIIYWDEKNLDKYRKAYESLGFVADDLKGSISTHLESFSGFNLKDKYATISYTPIMYDQNGKTVMLTGEQLDKYITSITKEAANKNDILKADNEGRVIDGMKISNIVGNILSYDEDKYNLNKLYSNVKKNLSNTHKDNMRSIMIDTVKDFVKFDNYEISDKELHGVHSEMVSLLNRTLPDSNDMNIVLEKFEKNMPNIVTDTLTILQNAIHHSKVESIYGEEFIQASQRIAELAQIAGVSVDKYLENQRTKELAKQINNTWNSEAFKESKEKLEDLAKTTGITASSIEELALENSDLADILDDSGMSAEYLASCFEDMAINGSSATDVLTTDMLKLNEIINEMEPSIQRANKAYAEYQAAVESGDYNDANENTRTVFEALGQSIENHEYGKDFKRSAYYLFGESAVGKSIDQIIEMYNLFKDREFFEEFDNGRSFIQYLGNNNILNGLQSYVDATNGYAFNIIPEDFEEIAKRTKLSVEVIAGLVQSLGMSAKDYTNYTPERLHEAIKEFDVTVNDSLGNYTLSLSTFKDMLSKTGAEAWEIDEILHTVEGFKDIELIDFSDTKNAKKYLESLRKTIQEVSKQRLVNGGNIIDLELLLEYTNKMNVAESEVQDFIETLNEEGYVFKDSFGNVYDSINSVISAMKINPQNLLSANLIELKNRAKDAIDVLSELESKYNKDFGTSVDLYTTDSIAAKAEMNKFGTIFEKEFVKNGEIDFSIEGANEAMAVMAALIVHKQSLSEPVIMTVNTDKLQDPEIKEEITQLKEMIETSNKLELATGLKQNTDVLIEEARQQVQAIQDSRLLEELNISINSDSTKEEVASAVADINEYLQEYDKDTLIKLGVDENSFSGAKSSIEKLSDNLNKLFSGEKELKIKFDITNKNALVDALTGSITISDGVKNQINTVVKTKGTGHNTLSAFADGTNNTDKNLALVGEEGTELLVRNGHYYELGSNSAELYEHKPGDIIFDANQTKQLLSDGEIKTGKKRGKAFAGGIPTSKKEKEKDKDSTKDKSSEGDTALDKFKEWFSKFFDWIEIKIERQSTKIDKYVNKAEASAEKGNYKTASSYYRSAISSTYDQIENQEAAYKKYSSHADTVINKAVKLGIVSKNTADTIKEKVKDGSIELKSYNEKTQEVISSYMEWYNKAQDSNNTITELHNNIRTYINDLKDMRDAQRDSKVEKLDTSTEIGTSSVSENSNSGLSLTNKNLKSQNTTYSNNTKNVQNDTKNIGNKAVKDAKKSNTAKKNKEYKKALNNAQSSINSLKEVSQNDLKTIKKYSEDTYNNLLAYNTALDNVENARMEEAVNYASTSAEIFDNKSQKYSNNEEKINTKINEYSSKADNANTVSRKNSLINKQNAEYDKIVANDTKAIKDANASISTAKKTIGKSNKSLRGSNYNSKNKKQIDKIIDNVQKIVKSGKEISAEIISKLATYYSEGKIKYAFYKACEDYNQALSMKAEYEAKKIVDQQTAIEQKKANAEQKVSNISDKYSELNEKANTNISTYEAKASNAASVKNKNANLQKAANQYSTIVNNSKKELDDMKSLVKSSSSDMKKAAGTSKLTKLKKNSKTRKTVQTAIDNARKAMKSGKQIPDGTMDNLYKYYEQGYIKETFITACENYNAAIEGKIQAEAQLEADKQTAKEQKASYGSQMLSNSQQEHLDKISENESAMQSLQTKQSLKTTKGFSLTKSDYEELKKVNANDEKYYRDLIKDTENTINENLKNGFWTENSQEYKDAIKQLAGYKDSAEQCAIKQEEWNNEIANLPLQKLQESLDLIDSTLSAISAEHDYNVKIGIKMSEQDYLEEIEQQENITKTNEELRDLAYQKMLKAQANGGAYEGKSVEDWEKDYENYKASVYNSKSAVEDLKNEMVDDVFWRVINDNLDKISKKLENIEWLRGLIDDDMMYDSDGNITEIGQYALALDIVNLEEAQNNVKENQAALKNLETLYSQGKYTEEKYAEEKKRINGDLRNSISSVFDIQKKLIQHSTTLAQKELDVLNEIIDARQKALNKKKEYYDFDKTISDKNKDIQSIKAQIAALSGATDTASKAELARLTEQLNEANEDLEETLMQHRFELESEGYDDLKETLQEDFDEYIKSVNNSFEAIAENTKNISDTFGKTMTDITSYFTQILKTMGVDTDELNLSESGFANGGIIRQIRKNGDSLLATVNPNETILTEKFTNMLPDVVDTMEKFEKIEGLLSSRDLASFSPVVQTINSNTNIDSLITVEGNVDKTVVGDLQDLASELAKRTDLLEAAYKHTTHALTKEARLNGKSRRY